MDEKKAQQAGQATGSPQPSSTPNTRADNSHAHFDAEKLDKTLTGMRADGKVEITEDDCFDELGYSFSSFKKWSILTVVFLVQVSMNFNTSLYSNAITGISEEYNVSAQAARCGAMIFLVAYAFGCELWAPWSEELGRKPILQLSLFLVNIWQLPVALAPNFASIMVGRFLGGLSSAGGSVTLGMVADMWDADQQQYAVAFIVFSSVGGSVLGPVVGGFVEAYLPWRWNIWIQLIFGGAVQLAHLLIVPETRTTIMMDNIAKKWRKSGKNPNIYGPNELIPFRDRFSAKEIMVTWIRPFHMFLTEPIVLTLSLLSGFSDALIFMFLQSFSLVYAQWEFSTVALGLSFLPLLVGYFIAYMSFIPAIERNKKQRAAHPHDEHAQFESRLWWLLFTAPCLPIGLIGFAWTSVGPPVHWIGTMIFSALIGIANYSIYQATVDYMIAAYGPYSASATGGNGWSRDFLAGVLTVPATPFYQNIGRAQGRNLEYASTILFCISVLLVTAVYVIYWKGPVLRKRSPFAQQLNNQKSHADSGGHRATNAAAAKPPLGGIGSRNNSFHTSQHAASVNASRNASRAASRNPSRNVSRVPTRTESVSADSSSGEGVHATSQLCTTNRIPLQPGIHSVE